LKSMGWLPVPALPPHESPAVCTYCGRSSSSNPVSRTNAMPALSWSRHHCEGHATNEVLSSALEEDVRG
jgi:hypothetical protein